MLFASVVIGRSNYNGISLLSVILKPLCYYFQTKACDCLFLALCIHVSPECKAILDQLGGYHLEERGAVEMKVSRSLV